MKKGVLVTEYFTISITIFFVMLGLVLASFFVVDDVIANPRKYILVDLPATEIQTLIVEILLIIACVSISYIIYLLLVAKTRTELSVLHRTKELNYSFEQFKKLYDDAPVPYLTLNDKAEIIDANNATLRFFGAIRKEIAGKNIFSYGQTEDEKEIEELYQYYKSNIPLNNKSIKMVTKSGAIKSVLLSVFKMENLESHAHLGLATIFDITEQKQLEKAKTEFVYLASHQLRTPVATMKWYGDMLLGEQVGNLNDQQKEYLQTMYRVNEDMIDLIDTLLNVSRAEVGKVSVELKPTNIQHIIEDVCAELAPLVESKKIIVNKQYNGKLENVETDPKLLRIVIQNLISNAVKYTPDGGQVGISLKDSLGEKSITVIDTGIGIPQNQQDKIFTKMFRADNASKLVQSGGNGLGLYLVKSIMELLQGEVSFESEENKGSVFTIRL